MAASRYPAKVIPPRLTRVVDRPRLFERLDEATADTLAWIAAPPGAGKTTLAASYVGHREAPCLWYQVDPRDGDPATFFHYLAIAAQKAAPRSRVALPPLTPEYLGGLPAFTRQYFERLYSRLPAGCLVVFDNYQELPEDSPLHELIALGLADRPPEIGAILVSRSAPPPPFARLRASDGVAVVDGGALTLTRDEVEAFVNQRCPEPLEPHLVDHLHRQSHGWAAGLVLMLARPPKPDATDPHEPPSQLLFDYFAGEVLDQTDPAIRTVLLKSALLPRMTPAMVVELCADERAGRTIADMCRQGYFTYRFSDRPTVYQYHPLFRDYLRVHGEVELPPDILAETRRLAAALLEDDGQLEDAIELFAKVADWPEVVRLLVTHAQRLLAQGRGQIVEGWIEALPEAVREGEPWLLFWQAACRLPFHPLASRDLFARAYHRFKERGEMVGTMLAWTGYVDAVEHGQGQADDPNEWLAEAHRTFLPLPDGLPPEIEAQVTLGVFNALLMWQPGAEATAEWAARAEGWLRRSDDPALRLRIAVHLVLDRIWRGDYAGARTLNDDLQGWAAHPEAPPLARLTATWVGEQTEWLTGSPAAAMERVEAGLQLGRESGVVVWEPMILAQGVEAALAVGDGKSAARWLAQLKTTLDPVRRPWDYAHHHHLACTAALNRGEWAAALEHAQRGFDAVRDNSVLHMEVLAHLTLAEALRAGHELDLADRQLSAAWPRIKATGSDLLAFMAHLIEAHLALDRSDEESAVAALGRGLALGRQRRFLNWWGFRAEPTVRLCETALAHGIEVAYVRDLIRERGLVPSEPLLHLPGWPWPVRLHTLGQFTAECDGEPVHFTGKAQKRPLELLRAIVALGGREVPLIDLEDALWFDADGRAARRSLDTTLHRLRKLLCHPECLIQTGSTLSLDPRHCWLDTWACEPLLERIESAAPSLAEQEVERLTERLLPLCTGPFLPGDRDALWAFAPREHLHARLLQALLVLGRHWESAGALDQAARCYCHATKVDPLAEPCYQRLMVALRELGRRDEAALVYRLCRAALATDDGRQPSAATEAAYARLTDPR